MLLGTGGYRTAESDGKKKLRGVTMSVVNQTPRGLHPAPYNGMTFLDGY